MQSNCKSVIWASWWCGRDIIKTQEPCITESIKTGHCPHVWGNYFANRYSYSMFLKNSACLIMSRQLIHMYKLKNNSNYWNSMQRQGKNRYTILSLHHKKMQECFSWCLLLIMHQDPPLHSYLVQVKEGLMWPHHKQKDLQRKARHNSSWPQICLLQSLYSWSFSPSLMLTPFTCRKLQFK